MVAGGSPNLIDHIVSERKKDVQTIAGVSIEYVDFLTSQISTDLLHFPDKPEQLLKKTLKGKHTNTKKNHKPEKY